MISFVSLLWAAGGCGRDGSHVLQDERYLVGAHYYSWYPDNFSRGCLRRVLEPKQAPELGLYDSWDVKVLEQQIAWCSRYGVDFLTLDWWPSRDEQSEYIRDVFLKARNIDDIKFCIFYETWSLNFNPGIGATTIDDKTMDRFVDSLVSFGDDFFKHSSYLHVNGRPVVILYLTRTLAGDFEKAISRLRREMKKKGYDPFIIGDEIFWNVSPVVKKGKMPFPLTDQPQASRINCFDAITSYNMYEGEMKNHAGYGAESDFLKDVAGKYQEYLDAADDDVCFVPSVIPGYNDRGGRLLSDHHVVPRRWAADKEEGSFFAESLDRLAFRFIDKRLNMMLVTSWNEWNEDTGIEPLAIAEDTDVDGSDTGKDYTCGYNYSGYGTKYLEVLRDKVVAVCGRVVNAEGKPVRGVNVVARQGGSIESGRSGLEGYYRISRLSLVPGECEVAVEGTDDGKRVEVLPDLSVIDVDFVVQ